MSEQTPKFTILLVDDDPKENGQITRIFKALTPEFFQIDFVTKCSEAVKRVHTKRYNLVLLDDRLSQKISAKFTVPMIKTTDPNVPIAVISNDISSDHLQSTKALGVDHIVDKANMVEFLRSQIEPLMRAG